MSGILVAIPKLAGPLPAPIETLGFIRTKNPFFPLPGRPDQRQQRELSIRLRLEAGNMPLSPDVSGPSP
ncbi:hypothetical protein SS05631_a41780 (plasmid) [Sinorhizobium sp. CCBAU 05631]|nr:hypothetical protein SS05631_a41780 [Sinorhizobium sp. CCBAU 05631]ASY73598.1 hypothetical protein SF83666_a40100 [Sinorhizobium fredii CCBAU 83666]